MKHLILRYLVEYNNPDLNDYVVLLEHYKKLNKLVIDDTLKEFIKVLLENAIKSHSVHRGWITQCRYF